MKTNFKGDKQLLPWFHFPAKCNTLVVINIFAQPKVSLFFSPIRYQEVRKFLQKKNTEIL